MLAALGLLATYLFMNSNKIQVAKDDWANIRTGNAASRIRLELAGETVFQQHLKASEIFDKAGNRQIHFMHLPRDVFARIQEDLESASLEIHQQKANLSRTTNESALLAVTKEKRIYLLDEDELKYMMTVIWNERLQSGTLVQCTPPQLCKSLNINSRDWGPVQGPFPDSELNPGRRGMPKGRWARGPETVLQIQSGKRQKVWMQINLLGVIADQQLRFRGAASQVQKIETDPEPLDAGGRELYPAAYLLALDLKPGPNYLEMSFSKWSKPARQGANPLAAYVVAIGLKQAD